MAESKKKSTFSVTCNRLSQFLRENRSLPDLGVLDLAPSIPPSSYRPPTTLNLLPGLGVSSKADTDTADTDSVPDAKEPLMKPLTIFYGGKVMIFDNFPPEKAADLMNLATGGGAVNSAPNFSSGIDSVVPMPMARRASLHRFLEKRKDRINSRAPYQMNGSSKKADQWLGLGQEASYEEIWAPQVEDFICISDRAYSQEQILAMEKSVLNMLEWSLTVPTPYVFLVRFIKAAMCDKEMEHMVLFFAELGLLQYSMIMYCPSMVAAAAVFAARCTLKKTDSRFERIGGDPSSVSDANAGEEKYSSRRNGVKSSNASMAEFIELVTRLPHQKKQFAVRDSLLYLQTEGKQLFESLYRDNDVEVSHDYIEVAMSKRGIPKRNNQHAGVIEVTGPQPAESLAQSVLKSALAGGIACSFSAFVMHPVDTVKTCVQASTLSLPELVSKLPEIGLQGLYKGSIPAVLGQFTSHGLRTGICEASKFVLMKAVPTLPDIQVQSMASFCGTILGTTSRVPSEVLKQRLQAGIFDNIGEAVVVTLRQDGMKGFFRGTIATLCRETPFYVLGMGLYEEAKKAMQKLIGRDLEPWETVVVGAVTGGLASVLTTPFDVIKTRMMTAPQGMQLSMQMAAVAILREEGPLALYRGAVPRFFWVAPLGAMNFAGYELLRKAMDGTKFLAGDQQREGNGC